MTWPATTWAESTRRLPLRLTTSGSSTKLSGTISTQAIIVTSAGALLPPGSSLCSHGAPAEEHGDALLGVLSWLERTVLGAQVKTTRAPCLLHIATLGFCLPTPLWEENPAYASIIIQIKHNSE